jgi:hypothetical protein
VGDIGSGGQGSSRKVGPQLDGCGEGECQVQNLIAEMTSNAQLEVGSFDGARREKYPSGSMLASLGPEKGSCGKLGWEMAPTERHRHYNLKV